MKLNIYSSFKYKITQKELIKNSDNSQKKNKIIKKNIKIDYLYIK